MRLAATRFLSVLTSAYLMAASSTFAHDKPQALAPESRSNVQEPALGEKIQDISPDKKFAVRIRYDAPMSGDTISSDAVHAVEIVTLPDKQPVEQLLGERASGFSLEDFKLLWSPDSKAFVFSIDDVRTSVVAIEELQGGKFVVANEPPDDLQIEVKGAFTQYVRPVRWLKPGELLLKEVAGFRDERAQTTLQLTAKKDAATGKYKIVSHKRVSAAKPK